MGKDTLNDWLDKALKDENWPFQSMLFNALDLDKESDKLTKKLTEAQTAEYKALGITIDGNDYYYRGKLVHILLDMQANKSFYTLNINPKGTINIKVVRNKNNKATSIVVLTEAEATKLLGDM